MRPRNQIALAAVLLLSATTAAPAAQQDAPKIALINGQRAIEESTIGRQEMEQVTAAAQQWDQRIQAVRDELDALTRQRQEQALTLNDDALARLNLEIEEKQVEIERMRDDAQRELTRQQQQATNRINSQFGPVVEQLATQGGYDLILDTSRVPGVLFFSDAIDVTDDFLALVNAAAPGTGPEPGE